MRPHLFGGFVLSALLFGCGGAETHGSSSGGGGPDTNPNDMTFATGSLDVPAGDSLTCIYLDVHTTKDLSVVGATGAQGPGGHHITAYWTDEQRSAQHHPCTDAEMISWHQFAAAGAGGNQGAEGIIHLQDGLATHVPAGKQIVVQAHYIEPKATTIDASITIHTIEAKDVIQYVNYFATIDTSFEVPPHAAAKHVTECVVPRDFDNVMFLGHMHEWGTHYRLEQKGGDVIYETEWEPLYMTHPPIDYYDMNKPFHLTKGETLIQTCEWANTTASPMTFPTEMCLGYFYYFPDAGELQCENKPVP